MDKETIRDIELQGKRALVRVDFNVPLDTRNLAIMDDTRIRAVLPTIKYLVDRGAKVILCSHLGRPGGEVVEGLRLAPVGRRLSELLGLPVMCAPDCIGAEVEEEVGRLKEGEVLLLENLRFHPEEEKNDPGFAAALARLGDVFVDDAFGVAHRTHASNVGVTEHLPAVAGFLLEREIEAMGKALEEPARPFTALVGGAKVSDKLGLLENIMDKVDSVLIGGGMVSTFVKALRSQQEKASTQGNKQDLAQRLMRKAEDRGVHLLLPTDVLVGDKFDAEARFRTVPIGEVPQNWYIMDIGSRTIELFEAKLRKSKTVVWNGPVGVFEFAKCRNGTVAMATVLAGLDATTIIGGGSTAEVVQELGLEDKMSHVSTGGGASLKFLEGKTLPGVAALRDKRE